MPTKKPQTWDHLKSQKKPAFGKVTIPTSDEALDEFNAAQAAVEEIEKRSRLFKSVKDTPEWEEVHGRLAAAKAEIAKTSITFHFKSIGRKAYDALVDEFPPSEEEIKEFREATGQKNGKPEYSSDGFPQALIAASLVDPVMSREDVQDMFDDPNWSGAEVVELYSRILDVNTRRRVVELGKG